jgi:hypothetical protein
MTDETTRLIERLEEAKSELEELREADEQQQQRPPQDPRLAFATAYRDALNRARSPWISLGGGDDDGPAAA